jgi:crotonobetainyl-CoA:carnitine CoA-transferase CaiB-like acyl-CoA transferase
MGGPLEGIKVIEMGVWVAAPAAGAILADWGADVIKIEPPGIGDPARMFQYTLGGDLPINPVFDNDNRSKRSIVADLRTPEGLQIALDLIAEADVFLSNVRPAGLARLGLGPEELMTRFPRLIYTSLTGYGNKGPEADRAAYDIAAFWSRSGIAHSLTQPGSPPPHQRGGMGDHNAGLAAAAGISAALYSREKTGEGQIVTTSLLREGIFTLSFDLSFALGYGMSIQIGNRKTMGNPAINNYCDSEGDYFWIVGLEGERHWPPLARAVGHPEWIEDPRYSEPRGRFENAEGLIAQLDEIFATKTREEWGKIFDAEEDLWWAPVQSIAEVIADPQVEAAGGWVDVPDGQTTTRLPASLNGSRPR